MISDDTSDMGRRRGLYFPLGGEELHRCCWPEVRGGVCCEQLKMEVLEAGEQLRPQKCVLTEGEGRTRTLTEIG